MALGFDEIGPDLIADNYNPPVLAPGQIKLPRRASIQPLVLGNHLNCCSDSV